MAQATRLPRSATFCIAKARSGASNCCARFSNRLALVGTIAIAEFVPNDERTGPPSALIFAVNMLVNTTEGGTYTFAEISKWLREAGFKNPRQLSAGGPSPLILATKP